MRDRVRRSRPGHWRRMNVLPGHRVVAWRPRGARLLPHPCCRASIPERRYQTVTRGGVARGDRATSSQAHNVAACQADVNGRKGAVCSFSYAACKLQPTSGAHECSQPTLGARPERRSLLSGVATTQVVCSKAPIVQHNGAWKKTNRQGADYVCHSVGASAVAYLLTDRSPMKLPSGSPRWNEYSQDRS